MTCRFRTHQNVLISLWFFSAVLVSLSFLQRGGQGQLARFDDMPLWSTRELVWSIFDFSSLCTLHRASDSTSKKGSMYDEIMCRIGAHENLFISFGFFVAYVASSFTNTSERGNLFDWFTCRFVFWFFIAMCLTSSFRQLLGGMWEVVSYKPHCARAREAASSIRWRFDLEQTDTC